MKTLVLDGSHAGDSQVAAIRTALQAQLPDAEFITLRQQKIGNCAGDFFCWVRNPGVCNTADDNREIAAKMVACEQLILLTPVTFGGYSSVLKQMVDHLIQNISPFFASIHGEIHHQPRYQRYPKHLVIGWMGAPDPRAEAVFRHLVQRSALNMYAPAAVCGILTGSQTETQVETQVRGWLAAIAAGSSTPVPELPGTAGKSGTAPQRAVLLVGSPRTRKSTSHALGDYLMAQLAGYGIAAETIQIYPAFSSAERRKAALASVAGADLLALAFPLYVDSLPAPVVAALESIAANRSEQAAPAQFLAIANCGFPEAAHNATALAICAQFARQSGFGWAGGLALGGGQGLVHGTPLTEMDGRAIPLKKAVEMTAAALAQGNPVPTEAQALMAKPIIPGWLYRFFGGFGWRQQAKRYGVQKRLRARPYEPAKLR